MSIFIVKVIMGRVALINDITSNEYLFYHLHDSIIIFKWYANIRALNMVPSCGARLHRRNFPDGNIGNFLVFLIN